MERSAGIFLPLFSVPGNQGIGDLGQKTFTMIDELSRAGYRVWSMLPLTVMQDEKTPSLAASSFAGDPIYINIDRLAEMGLLTQSSIINHNKFKNFVDFQTVREFKEFYFQRAFKAFRKNYSKFKPEFEAFKKEAFWLNNWTVYEVFRQSHDKQGWTKWPEDFQSWPEQQTINLRDYVEKIFYVQFLQFLFYKQLDEVTSYARSKGLKLMQDLPFYHDLDSAEVWSRKKEFMIRPDGTMIEMAGSAPDPVDINGINYGQPMYNFDALKASDYKTFRQRASWLSRNFDAIRLVNFKSMDTAWKIPEGHDARDGKYVCGPGRSLLEVLIQDNPSTTFTAEDIGFSKASLKELEKDFHIPGMDVLEFRLETKLLKRPAEPNTVIYTSTYDTMTLEEDYNSFTNNKKIALRRFFKKRGYDHRPFHDLVCHYALDSDADLVMLCLPDVIGLKDISATYQKSLPEEERWIWKLKDFKTFPADLQKTRPWIENSNRLINKEK